MELSAAEMEYSQTHAKSSLSPAADVPSPTNRQEFQTLGMANYMGPFISNLSTLTSPLREL